MTIDADLGLPGLGSVALGTGPFPVVNPCSQPLGFVRGCGQFVAYDFDGGALDIALATIPRTKWSRSEPSNK